MKRRLLFPATACAALVALLAWPLTIRALTQSMTDWEALVRIKLGAIALVLSVADAGLVYNPVVGTLESNTYRDIAVKLYKGERYALIGVCDDDCLNLNMRLYDEDGEFVGANTRVGTHPDLEIIPRHTQRFTLRMIMKRCAADPCYYGLGVYGN